ESTPNGELSDAPPDFESITKAAQVRSRDEVEAETSAQEGGYSPVTQTANYMRRAVETEEKWETTLQQAREDLLVADPRDLYFNFICDLADQIEQSPARAGALAHVLQQVAVRGLGMSEGYGRHLYVSKPQKGSTRWRVRLDSKAIRNFLQRHIVGEHFL